MRFHECYARARVEAVVALKRLRGLHSWKPWRPPSTLHRLSGQHQANMRTQKLLNPIQRLATQAIVRTFRTVGYRTANRLKQASNHYTGDGNDKHTVRSLGGIPYRVNLEKPTVHRHAEPRICVASAVTRTAPPVHELLTNRND